jgi:transposase
LTAKAPRAVEFCVKLQRFALRLCKLGRELKSKKLSRSKAGAMIPNLRRQLHRFADGKLEHEAAETLRSRVMEKDRDKLFTFLKVKGVSPTNNLAERGLRFLVIMRKICFGTRSAAGSESHGVLSSLLQTAKLQGKNAIGFLTKLITEPLASAKAALFAKGL